MKNIDEMTIDKRNCAAKCACELLAPAGDEASFYTAIGNGADAVYLGLEGFNARMKADNFKEETLITCINYAHFYGAKVYITLNTLVRDNEFSELISLVTKAVAAHADAFIVQDLGVAAVLRKCFPNIVLHASTQIGIHNVEGAKIAEKLGFSRVVLSRETKLADIKAINQATNIELEYFVHGALCVCFSGNCYLSEAEFNASGNRGQCKQLCRMEYSAYQAIKGNEKSLNNGENSMNSGKKSLNNGEKLLNSGEKLLNCSEKLLGKGYLLSARDLCLIDSLQELALAGICSFKIEGRMRRSGYVGETVKIYRKAIDEICVKNVVKTELNSAKSPYSARYLRDMSSLRVAYSRGEYLNRAYLDKGAPTVVNKAFANHIGIEIGEVRSVKPFKNLSEITIFSTRKINDGDGIKFIDNGIEKDSLGAANVTLGGKNLYKIISTAKVKVGYKAYLIMDSSAEKGDFDIKRTLPISIEVTAKMYHPVHLSATAQTINGSVTCEVWGDNAEEATNLPMSAAMLAEQLSKVGDSGFEVSKIDVDTDSVFIAKSVLNALRRQLFEELKAAVIELAQRANTVTIDTAEIAKYALKPIKKDTLSVKMEKNDKFTLHFMNEKEVYKSTIIAQGEIVILRPNIYDEKTLNAMIEALEISDKSKLGLELPVIANGRDKEVLDRLLQKFNGKIEYLVCENLYALAYKKYAYKLIAGCGLNIANGHAANALVKILGVEAVIKSSEADTLNTDVKIADTYTSSMNLLGARTTDMCATDACLLGSRTTDMCATDACLLGSRTTNMNIVGTKKADIKTVKTSNYFPLMTLAHCPMKTLGIGNCDKCAYRDGMTLKRDKQTYALRKIVVSDCYFQLYKI